MNYGQVKNASLKHLDEFSSRGAVQGATKIADLSLKVQDAVNDAYYDLASTVAKIDSVQVMDRMLDESLVEYDLPDDYLDKNYVVYKLDNGLYQETTAFQIIDEIKKIILPYSGVVYSLFYYKKPALLTFTGDNVVNDAQTFEISEEAQRLIPYYVAGVLIGSEGDTNRGNELVALYRSKKREITKRNRPMAISSVYRA